MIWALVALAAVLLAAPVCSWLERRADARFARFMERWPR